MTILSKIINLDSLFGSTNYRNLIYVSKNNIFFPILVSLQTIFIYSIFNVIIEYFFLLRVCQTETLISGNAKTFVFFIIFTIILFFNIISKKQLLKPAILIIFFFLSSISIVVSNQLHKFFTKRSQDVTICSLSSDWGIQGKEIIIYGQNFSPEWQPGSVFVDNFQLRIVSWTENKITVEQPVPTSYFKGELFVINSDGVTSNFKPFEIRNPNDLNKVNQIILRYQFLKNK